jgi:hypothetical protein
MCLSFKTRPLPYRISVLCSPPRQCILCTIPPAPNTRPNPSSPPHIWTSQQQRACASAVAAALAMPVQFDSLLDVVGGAACDTYQKPALPCDTYSTTLCSMLSSLTDSMEHGVPNAALLSRSSPRGAGDPSGEDDGQPGGDAWLSNVVRVFFCAGI